VIERIKQEISLVRLAESQGHQLKKHGKDYALNCPFHEDKTASLLVQYPSTIRGSFSCLANRWRRRACSTGRRVADSK